MSQAALSNDDLRVSQVAKLMRSADFIWEAVSVDGVVYPFDTNRYGMSENQRTENIIKCNEYDIALAMKISELNMNGDYTELGRLIGKQIDAHGARTADAHFVY